MGAARPTSSRPTRSPPPPGAGKTPLVATYLDARGLAAAWYRVDEGDRDIASFFHYLTLAVRQAAPRGKALPVFSPEYGAAPGAFARLFFREGWERLGDRILVLDDYQDARSPSTLVASLRQPCRHGGSRARCLSPRTRRSRSDPQAAATAARSSWCWRSPPPARAPAAPRAATIPPRPRRRTAPRPPRAHVRGRRSCADRCPRS